MKIIIVLKLSENEMIAFSEFLVINPQFWVIVSWSKDSNWNMGIEVIVILSASNDEDFALLQSKFGKQIKSKKEVI